ncbi:MAG: insulinase family protein, partial [Myxococcales bacterium]|nr:insulinase family protein [Myxococcales bacterium]
LNLNLREEKGYTYGARGGLYRWRGAGMYMLGAAVKADTTLASLQETLKELAGMFGDKPLTADEREQALGNLLLSFPGRFEQLAAVAGQYAGVRLEGHDAEWFRKWPQSLAKVTLAEARAEAKRLTDPKGFAIVVAGDAAKLREPLKALGLPIVDCDAQGRLVPVESSPPPPAEGTETPDAPEEPAQ